MPKRSSLDKLFDALSDAIYDAAMDAAESLKQPVTGSRAFRPHPPSPKPPRPPKTRPTPPKPQESTLYDTLEVSPRASQETITAAFRSLSQKYHPDKNHQGEVNENSNAGRSARRLQVENDEKIRTITAAYSTLKSPTARKQYDRSIGLKG